MYILCMYYVWYWIYACCDSILFKVPKIGAKQVFIAINPSPGSRPFQSNTNGSPANRQPQKPQQQKPQQPQQQTSKPPSSLDQVKNK